VALLPSMTQLGYGKLRCAHVDLDGWGWLGVRLRQLLFSRFVSLQRLAAGSLALQGLLQCATTPSEIAQADLIANGLHGLQWITAASPT
jgi:hypothetical protein